MIALWPILSPTELSLLAGFIAISIEYVSRTVRGLLELT